MQKVTDDLTVFLAHLESGCVKAARRMLMKLIPGRDEFEDGFRDVNVETATSKRDVLVQQMKKRLANLWKTGQGKINSRC